MRFFKSPEEKRRETRARVEGLLRAAGLTVDPKGNVWHGDFLAGSLTPEGDFTYHPSNEYAGATETAREVIRQIGRSSVNYWNWTANP